MFHSSPWVGSRRKRDPPSTGTAGWQSPYSDLAAGPSAALLPMQGVAAHPPYRGVQRPGMSRTRRGACRAPGTQRLARHGFVTACACMGSRAMHRISKLFANCMFMRQCWYACVFDRDCLRLPKPWNTFHVKVGGNLGKPDIRVVMHKTAKPSLGSVLLARIPRLRKTAAAAGMLPAARHDMRLLPTLPVPLSARSPCVVLSFGAWHAT